MKFSEERSMFIENLINEIHATPMQRIIGSRIELIPRGRHLMALCPFHRDRHLGSFLVTPDKGLWSCFTCGDDYSGDAISFVSKYDNVTWIEAVWKIGLEEGLCSREEYEKYTKQGFTKKQAETIRQRVQQPKQFKSSAPEQDPVVNDLVYRKMAELSPLSEKHLEHLRNERMLSDEEIKDFFEFPYTHRDTMISQLFKTLPWLTPEVLVNVPGFFFDKKEKKVSYAGYRGMGILIKDVPYRNQDGYGQKVLAIQIRKDTIKEGELRYCWFSSSFAMYDTDKYEGGNTCNSPKDVVFPKEIDPEKSYTVCITEGKFKALKMVSSGNGSVIGISVQGVSTWAGIEDAVKRISRIVPVKRVLTAFDADMVVNPSVFKHSEAMSIAITALGFPVKQLVWLVTEGKGIDDLINAGYGQHVKVLESTEAARRYHAVLERTLNEYGGDIRKIPEGQIDDFFLELRDSLEKALFFM